MSLTVVLRKEARQEFDEAFDWYEAQRQGLGTEFAEAVQVILDRIGKLPELHPVVRQDIRQAVMRKFPYAVFYRVEAAQVLVIAIFHQRRDPRIWHARASLN